MTSFTPNSDGPSSRPQHGLRFTAAVAFASILLVGCAELNAFGNNAMRFRTHAVTDPMTDLTAFRLLVPDGWQVRGGVRWHHDRANLASVEATVGNPKSLEQVEFLPTRPFTWVTQWVIPFPQGSNYLGCEVQPVIGDPRDYVTEFVWPEHRSAFEGRVVDAQELPAVARAVADRYAGDGVNRTVRAARVRVEYELNGRPVEEDFYCVTAVARNPLAPQFTLWGPESVFSLRAEKGRLDAATPHMLACAHSVRFDLAWMNRFLQVQDMWNQNVMASIRQAGVISRIISQTNDEISAIRRAAWENQQASYDRIHARFADYVRGVTRYDSPYQIHPVELPSGYRHAWANPLGEYILSDEAGFNPNVGSTQTWEPLNPVR